MLSGLFRCSNFSSLSLSRLWARSVAIELLRTIDVVGEMRVSLVLLETTGKRKRNGEKEGGIRVNEAV